MNKTAKTVLITGCSSGIGRALAEEFHCRHYNVYATARNIESLAGLKAKGIHTLSLDVNDDKNVAEVVSDTIDAQGRIDILVNNAGYAAIGPMVDMPLDKLRLQFETNVFAAINLIQQVVPHMQKAKNGMIVNIGSVSGILTTPFAGAYCATKASLHALSDALRMELAPFNIKVITVQPGAIQSNFGERADGEVEQNVKPDSSYAPIRDAIHARAKTSQENPTPVAEFAQKLVAELIRQKPKTTIRLGKGGHTLPLLKRLLPDSVLDKMMSKKFKLNQLS